VRFIRGAVIADWKLFPIPRKTAWNTAGFAIFVGPYVDPKIEEKYNLLTIIVISSEVISEMTAIQHVTDTIIHSKTPYNNIDTWKN